MTEKPWSCACQVHTCPCEQARFLSRFTRASSGEKAASSSKTSVRSPSAQTASAAGGADHSGDADAATASVSADPGDGEQTGAIELLEVDPAELDRPEGAVGADAPDPEDADSPAVRQMRSDQEVRAAAMADEPATAARLPLPQISVDHSDAPKGEAVAGAVKQRGRPARNRRGAASAQAGQRVTRARAGAAVAQNESPHVEAQPQADVPHAGGRLRRSNAGAAGAANEVAARPNESAPAAASDCVLLDEAPELSPGQHGDAASAPPERAKMLPGPTPRGSLQHDASGSAHAGAPFDHGAAAASQLPAASDSEQSSAMVVTPHLRAEQDVDSSAANPAAARCGGEGQQAPERDPSAVRQVRLLFWRGCAGQGVSNQSKNCHCCPIVFVGLAEETPRQHWLRSLSAPLWLRGKVQCCSKLHSI